MIIIMNDLEERNERMNEVSVLIMLRRCFEGATREEEGREMLINV
jgi:hypothetical protein